MNILLLKTYWPYPYSKGEYTYNRIWPPLSLLNCAALLEKEGHKAEILDAHALRIKLDKIAGYVTGYDKIFVTSSSLDRWQCPNIDIEPFLESVRRIKEINDEVYIMGYHGTVEPEEILKSTVAKAVIRGEPEYTVQEICRNNNLFKIEGLSFNNGMEIIHTPQREPLDLKNLPVPSYRALDFNKYFYEILGRNFALFEISRGCGYQCKFCNNVMYGKGSRTKSAGQIIEELREAIEQHNVKAGYFIDLEFLSNSNRKTVIQLCEFLIEKGYDFKWCCQTRPDSVDMGILRKMKEAGCRLIHLGVESGLQRFLDYMDKNISIEKIKESVKICKQADIRTLAFFLFGMPGETVEDRSRVFEFAKQLNTKFVSFHKIFSYKSCENFHSESKFDGEIDKFIRKSVIRYYLRPAWLYKLDISVILSGLRLFRGRIRSLR